MAATPSAVISAVVAALGLVLVLAGLVEGRRYRRARTAEPSDAVEVSPGLAAVEGTARERDGTVTAPLSGRECLAYAVDVERRAHMPGSYWIHRTTDEAGVPFVLGDSTGEVTVDPTGAGAKLVFGESTRVVIDRDERPPPALRQYLDGLGIDHRRARESLLGIDVDPRTDVTPGDRHRLTERRLDAGEGAFVFGAARHDVDGVRIGSPVERAGVPARIEESLRPPLVVADGTRATLDQHLRERAQVGWILAVVGVVLVGLALLV